MLSFVRPAQCPGCQKDVDVLVIAGVFFLTEKPVTEAADGGPIEARYGHACAEAEDREYLLGFYDRQAGHWMGGLLPAERVGVGA